MEEKSAVVKLDSQNFHEAISGDKPVIVDFWAEWCAPCHYMHPIFERVAKKYSGCAVFGRVNVDENAELAETHGIIGIPTFIVFIEGKPVDRLIGVAPEQEFESFVKKWVKSKPK